MDLKIFANTVEQEVYDQVNKLMSVDIFKDAKVRIMPDTHAGKGCVIGFTADLGDKVVPNLVGCDIGCGVYVVYLGKHILSDSQLKMIDQFIHESIPSGKLVNDDKHSVGFENLQDLRMWKHLKNVEHLYRSICTLGSGNHYCELDKDNNDGLYLVIHTGSRNLGQQVCKYYQNMAIEDCNVKSNELKSKVAYLIMRMKLQGKEKEIKSAIYKLKEEFRCVDRVPSDLCYLQGEHRDDYLHDMKICQEYARKNREEIARRICDFMHDKFGINIEYSFHTVHNYIDFEDNIIRKGAIRCNNGEKVAISLSMRDGTIIGIGKGNTDWNCSGPHGAGRIMSRNEARQRISIDDFKASMKDVYTTCVNENTLDESPMAYKDASEIIELIKDTVDIIEVIRPIYNFKSST